MVPCGGDQFMNVWFAASDSIKGDCVFCQVNVGANEFVRTCSFHQPPVSHDFHVLLVCCSPNENHLALRFRCVVQHPSFWNLPACWRCFVSFVIFHSHSINILIRLALYFGQIVKVKSLPHTKFPTSVVAFDRRLKASFPRKFKVQSSKCKVTNSELCTFIPYFPMSFASSATSQQVLRAAKSH